MIPHPSSRITHLNVPIDMVYFSLRYRCEKQVKLFYYFKFECIPGDHVSDGKFILDVEEAAAQFDVSASTIYRWVKFLKDWKLIKKVGGNVYKAASHLRCVREIRTKSEGLLHRIAGVSPFERNKKGQERLFNVANSRTGTLAKIPISILEPENRKALFAVYFYLLLKAQSFKRRKRISSRKSVQHDIAKREKWNTQDIGRHLFSANGNSVKSLGYSRYMSFALSTLAGVLNISVSTAKRWLDIGEMYRLFFIRKHAAEIHCEWAMPDHCLETVQKMYYHKGQGVAVFVHDGKTWIKPCNEYALACEMSPLGRGIEMMNRHEWKEASTSIEPIEVDFIGRRYRI